MSFIDDGEKGLPFELINLPGKARWPGSTRSVGRRAELLFVEERRRLKLQSSGHCEIASASRCCSLT
jgi:hypothetical protein